MVAVADLGGQSSRAIQIGPHLRAPPAAAVALAPLLLQPPQYLTHIDALSPNPRAQPPLTSLQLFLFRHQS